MLFSSHQNLRVVQSGTVIQFVELRVVIFTSLTVVDEIFGLSIQNANF